MQIMIESTDQITTLDGVECRVWHGTTEQGVACILFIHRLAVHKDQDAAAFDAELREMPVPRCVPLREVLP